MTKTEAKARIEAAFKSGVLSAKRTQMAYAAIESKVYYGNRMTPRAIESIIVNRFGI